MTCRGRQRQYLQRELEGDCQDGEKKRIIEDARSDPPFSAICCSCSHLDGSKLYGLFGGSGLGAGGGSLYDMERRRRIMRSPSKESEGQKGGNAEQAETGRQRNDSAISHKPHRVRRPVPERSSHTHLTYSACNCWDRNCINTANIPGHSFRRRSLHACLLSYITRERLHCSRPYCIDFHNKCPAEQKR